jgi:hypothetical protein
MAAATSRAAPTWSVAAAIVLGLVVLWLEASVDVVCAFTFAGVALLIVALFWKPFGWQIALTITSCAFVYDLVEKLFEERSLGGSFPKWAAAAVTAMVLGCFVSRRERTEKPMTRWAFLTLMWLAVGVSYFKSLGDFLPLGAHTVVELIFTLSAAWLTWLVLKEIHRGNPQIKISTTA